ncbi:hypothetical protein Tco_1352542 [Tanacetum coccineum]
MHELREDTFSRNKNKDAHDHIDRVLNIVGLFNIPGVSKDAVMLRVFPFTLIGSAKRYFPPSMTAKQLEDIHNLKQEGDESLYQAWERYNDLLYKCPTHDINNHQKVNIFYKGLSTMNRQLLDSQGPIPEMRPAQALTTLQTMADHSQKWYGRTTRKNIGSSSSNDGLAALVNKLDNMGRDMKKLKESVHAIQVGCQICEGPHLDKDCPLNEEVKQVKETDNRPTHGKKRQNSEELLAKHQEESARRSTKMEGWIKKLQEITVDQETSGLNKLHRVSFISGPESDTPEVLQHQLPPKELNPGSFTLPCTIGKFNFYAMADLDMSKKAPLGIVENVLVKIDKFLSPSDFIIIGNNPSETTILWRPFLATIHTEIDVSTGKISLGINDDRISFDTMRKYHNYTNPTIVNNPTHMSFDDYKWEFNLEIDKLADEYELGIVIIEQRVKVDQKASILELKRRNYEEHCSDNLNAVSIKEDTAYLCLKLHSGSMKRRPIRRI